MFSFLLSRAVPKSVLAGALAVGFAFPGAIALGQAPQPETKASSAAKPADPKARALLDEVPGRTRRLVPTPTRGSSSWR